MKNIDGSDSKTRIFGTQESNSCAHFPVRSESKTAKKAKQPFEKKKVVVKL